MNLHVFCLAFVAARVEPVRTRLLADGLPKGQRRAMLVPLRRRAEKDALELGRALLSIAAPQVRPWLCPGPPPAAVQAKLNDTLVAMATGKRP